MSKKRTMAAANDEPFALSNIAASIVDEMKGTETAPTISTSDDAVKVTSGAAAGCKPGSTRHTYVMPLEMISKLKAIAGYHGKPEVAIVLDMLTKGIEEQEQKYGVQVSDIQRGNN